ncbi:hypothetical protein F183_A14860 [Bryobacterales bacterium F-183]|nr:hypothetical protein F183_A14860 [Bryobacterales bacterium F-183]
MFSLLDDEELRVLADRVSIRGFTANQTIFKAGGEGHAGFVLISGAPVRVSIVDRGGEEVTLDEVQPGGIFGFASLLQATPHQTTSTATGDCRCIEVERQDLRHLVHAKPDAAMDMLSVLGRHLHQAHSLVAVRSIRNPNELIESTATRGDRIADAVAQFGGSWRFLILFGIVLTIYIGWNSSVPGKAWDPYPFILLNLFLSLVAAVQAPVILMSQNRQAERDRLRGELDYEVNRKAEVEVRGIDAKLDEVKHHLAVVENLLHNKNVGR